MRLETFKGGIHPQYNKEYTHDKELLYAKPPKVVYIPVKQHIGVPTKPIVKIGDEVKLAQIIGEAPGDNSSNVHSSVSGKVIAIENHATYGLCIVIENDFQETLHESITPKKDLKDLSKEEIVRYVKEAGIVGMGGAAFPTHGKLRPPRKKLDYIILNGAECEPYITTDHRVMLEKPKDVIYGLKAIMKALDVEKAIIGIEINKQNAIESINEVVKDEENIEIVTLKVKYPQGAKKQLIYACTGKEVPSGGSSSAAGVAIFNVSTAAQIAIALKSGMPLIQKNTTITGSCIKEPTNLIIKIGTPVDEILTQCGGITKDKEAIKLIIGGPMMGSSQYNLDIVVDKTTSSILCLSEKESRIYEPKNCIRCGRCTDVCPGFLQPSYVSAHSLKGNFEIAKELNALDCMECGSCSYICPARRPLVESIRHAKQEIKAKSRK